MLYGKRNQSNKVRLYVEIITTDNLTFILTDGCKSYTLTASNIALCESRLEVDLIIPSSVDTKRYTLNVAQSSVIKRTVEFHIDE